MDDHLDDAKIEQLRAWAIRLDANGNDELRAAGKAIILLIGEVERSRLDVATDMPEEPAPQDAEEDGDDRGEGERTMERTLRSRLSRLRDRSSA